jgi:hypothetical protein
MNKKPHKVIIAGGRSFSNYAALKKVIEQYLDTIDTKTLSLEVVSGNANGADKLGERYAEEHNHTLHIRPAKWQREDGSTDKGAGYKRNIEMANESDALIAFWNGESKGTAHMIQTIKKLNKPAYLVMYRD